jgi:hypothetical protein
MDGKRSPRVARRTLLELRDGHVGNRASHDTRRVSGTLPLRRERHRSSCGAAIDTHRRMRGPTRVDALFQCLPEAINGTL